MNLLTTLLIALVLCAIGFVQYVYFFSVGYGLAIAGVALALLIAFGRGIAAVPGVLCILLLAYGLRLGGYLLYRELKSAAYKRLLKDETQKNVPVFVKVSIWLACGALYMCMTAPVLFRLRKGLGNDGFVIVGTALAACGIAMEALADLQKSRAKKANPGRFVSTGLYRFVRCPNYFGELTLWTGVFISGFNACAGAGDWLVAVVGYLGIVYVMFSGARRLELRQERNYGADPEYRAYVKKTPIIVPFLPIYTVKDHKWLVA